MSFDALIEPPRLSSAATRMAFLYVRVDLPWLIRQMPLTPSRGARHSVYPRASVSSVARQYGLITACSVFRARNII
jgi:hypothetical protein